ncbi:hypothetical protein IT084_01765 [Desulfallas sp. Bu1-1]|uniref:hypothetical protein n=1 Tax=Desulfallas sp. Bu1-1 TaxID=2787620 RepID=UPI0018A05DB6|nr:hypothetical protein [Desulfallas sp. Bu1-1]MBF7081709.1 hypothetical protein [Desulfallas sp. Bu1-1]
MRDDATTARWKAAGEAGGLVDEAGRCAGPEMKAFISGALPAVHYENPKEQPVNWDPIAGCTPGRT